MKQPVKSFFDSLDTGRYQTYFQVYSINLNNIEDEYQLVKPVAHIPALKKKIRSMEQALRPRQTLKKTFVLPVGIKFSENVPYDEVKGASLFEECYFLLQASNTGPSKIYQLPLRDLYQFSFAYYSQVWSLVWTPPVYDYVPYQWEGYVRERPAKHWERHSRYSQGYHIKQDGTIIYSHGKGEMAYSVAWQVITKYRKVLISPGYSDGQVTKQPKYATFFEYITDYIANKNQNIQNIINSGDELTKRQKKSEYVLECSINGLFYRITGAGANLNGDPFLMYENCYLVEFDEDDQAFTYRHYKTLGVDKSNFLTTSFNRNCSVMILKKGREAFVTDNDFEYVREYELGSIPVTAANTARYNKLIKIIETNIDYNTLIGLIESNN